MINYLQIDGADVAPLVSDIEESCEGFPRAHASLACLIVAIAAQIPGVSNEELSQLVTQISELIAAVAPDPENMN